jgi:hypothetical protein
MVLSMVNNRKLEITMQISFSGFNVALYFASYVYIKRTFNVKSIDSFINVTLKAIIKWPGFDPRPDLWLVRKSGLFGNPASGGSLQAL